MDERLRFVARLLDGEKMAPLCCAEFGISRKTESDAERIALAFATKVDCGERRRDSAADV